MNARHALSYVFFPPIWLKLILFLQFKSRVVKTSRHQNSIEEKDQKDGTLLAKLPPISDSSLSGPWQQHEHHKQKTSGRTQLYPRLMHKTCEKCVAQIFLSPTTVLAAIIVQVHRFARQKLG